MSATVFENYISLFFEGENLDRTLIRLCNLRISVPDSVCYVLLCMIKSPVLLTLTHLGLVPFKDRYMLVVAYKYMTPTQRQFLKDVTGQLQQDGVGLLSTQMGGGAVIEYIHNSNFFIDPVNILSSFCRIVMQNSGKYSVHERRVICDIIVQRIGSTVGLCRRDLQRIHSTMQETCSLDSKTAITEPHPDAENDDPRRADDTNE